MFGDIPEFGNNEEAEVFAICWSHSDLHHRSQKRPRPEYPPRWPNPRQRQQPFRPPYGNHFEQPPRQPQQDPLRLLTRVVLQQEEVISRLRQDKVFMLFMKQTEEGTLGSLIRVAKEWHRQKSQETSVVRSPLRTVLMSSMIKELLNLAQQAVATEENKARMLKAEWLTTSSEWTYKTWNHTECRLKLDAQRTPLQHDEAVRILNYLLEHLNGDAVQRFGSTVQLPKLEQQGAQMATFALEMRELPDEPHRGLHEEGHPPEISVGQDLGQPILPKVAHC